MLLAKRPGPPAFLSMEKRGRNQYRPGHRVLYVRSLSCAFLPPAFARGRYQSLQPHVGDDVPIMFVVMRVIDAQHR